VHIISLPDVTVAALKMHARVKNADVDGRRAEEMDLLTYLRYATLDNCCAQ